MKKSTVIEPGETATSRTKRLPQTMTTTADTLPTSVAAPTQASPVQEGPTMTAGEMVHRVCGTKTRKVALALATQVANLQVWQRPDAKNLDDAITMVTSFLTEIGPRNGLEALLAVQMIGVHEAATWYLHRANAERQTFQGSDANVLRATRLMRLFNEQLEAMAKLKGTSGQRRVTVDNGNPPGSVSQTRRACRPCG